MFTVIAGILFLLLAIIWTHKNLPNLAIKLGFFLMAVWGGYLVFTHRLLG